MGNLPEGEGTMQVPIWGVSQISSCNTEDLCSLHSRAGKWLLVGIWCEGAGSEVLVFLIRKGPFAHPAHIPLCPFFSSPAAESLPFQRSVLGTQKKELKETIPS